MSNFIAIKDSVINLELTHYVILEDRGSRITLRASFTGGGYAEMEFESVEEARKELDKFLMATLPPMGSRGGLT